MVGAKIAHCKRCDVEFIKKTANQLFCSYRCKVPLVKGYADRVGEVKMVTGECRECAKEFLKRATNPNQFCCSDTCYRQYLKRTQRQTKPMRDCRNCGIEFTSDGNTQYTCSPTCKQQYYEKRGIKCATVKCDCGEEMLMRADSKSVKKNQWICHKCLYSDAKTINCEKCGLRTRSFGGRKKCVACIGSVEEKPKVKCDICEAVIRRAGQTRCAYCKERPWQVSEGPPNRKRGPYKPRAAAAPKLPLYPCATCKAGKANAASETGWECGKSATVCRPWAGAKLHEQR